MSHGTIVPKGHGFSIDPTLIRPKSRGFVGLLSGDPLEAPLIQPNYFEHPDDLQLLVKSFRLSFELAHAKSFEEFRGDLYEDEKIGSISPNSSDGEIAEYIRNNVETLYHPVGTCKLGGDKMAVVDSHLKVYGTDNLRVVDASVFPEAIGGNPNAAVIMIAEKASDLIKNARNH